MLLSGKISQIKFEQHSNDRPVYAEGAEEVVLPPSSTEMQQR